ncbi:lipase family protein, partial [Metallibacterium sp.]
SLYDTLGQRIAVQQTEQLSSGTVSATTRVYSYDGGGQILGRTDGTVSGTGSSATFTALAGATTANPDALAPQHDVYAEGHGIATLGATGTIQLSDGLSAPAATARSNEYTAQAGDTLQSIAQNVYGNATLWYVIADANAISLDSSGNAINLIAGTTLKLPAVSNEQNSSQTFDPYNPLQRIGSTTPALAYIPPPPQQHCNDLTTLIVVAVTIAVTVYTAGAAAEALGAEATGTTAAGVGATGAAAAAGSSTVSAIGAAALTGGTLTAAGGATLGLGTDLLAAGIGGFAGSVAGQLAGQALGDGAGFSLEQALAGGLTGMASAGLGDLAGSNNLYQSIAKGDIGNAVLQGGAMDLAGIAANRIVGLPGAFSWASVAAASLAAGLSADLAPKVLGDLSLTANTMPGDIAQGLTSGVIGRNVDLALGQAAPSYGTIVGDAFGNAIGNDLSGVDAYRQGQVQYQQQQQQEAIAALSPTQHDNYTLLLQRGLAPAQALALATQLAAAPMMMESAAQQQSVYAKETATGSTLSGNATAAFWSALDQGTAAGGTPLDAATGAWQIAGLVPITARVNQMSAKLATMSPLDTRYYPLQAEITALTTALISQDVYFNQSIPQILPNGITRLSSEGLAQSKLGSVLTASMLSDPTSGFFSAVYADKGPLSPLDQNFIIADRGTQGGLLGPDWRNNFEQGFGLDSQQYDEAAKVAQAISKTGFTNVVFTGHSLGGGLATLQSAITGLHAYTFNAAGVNDATFARAHAPYVQQLPQLVSAYFVDHELLSTLQDYSPAPSAEGTRIELAPVLFNSQTPNSEAPIPWYQDYNPSEMFALHSIVEVAHALNYQLNQLMGPSGGTNP